MQLAFGIIHQHRNEHPHADTVTNYQLLTTNYLLPLLPLDLASLRFAYASGAVTPTALIDELLRRIEQHGDPAIWIHRLSRDELLAHAQRVEARGQEALPLYGVPFAIKDNIDLAGAPTTAACAEFAYVPVESAPVVQRLIEAGAIPIGKTNLDQFATGLVGVRSPFGVPRNPYRSDIIPGGSSSGSAVAVAARLVSFALGTDTAGSGRVPAGLNNLVGLKPTRGAFSTRGVVPACRSLDCVSIFALNCTDAEAISEICEHHDREDPFSRARPPETDRPAEAPSPGINVLRVGVPAAAQLEFFGDHVSARLFSDAVARFRSLGATVTEIDFGPFREAATLLYQGPWIAERWAALREFHGQNADAFFPVTRKIIESGKLPSAADAFDGFYRLEALKTRASAEWQTMDVLMVPTLPRPYSLADVAADPVGTNTRLGTYTNFVNLLDLSALALPAGFRADGIPHGVTLIAPAWGEKRLLEVGQNWEVNRPFEADGVVGSSHLAVGEEQQNSRRRLSIRNELPTTNRQLPTASPAPIRLAVVGAHLSGLPLNHQLTDLGAKQVWTGHTAPVYRLYALPNTAPPKPGLKRVNADGNRVAVEVWELSTTAFGQFVATIPAPMCIGTVALETGETVKGFLCEPAALDGAVNISEFGGWRAYIAAQQSPAGKIRS